MNQNFIGCVIILNIRVLTGVIGYKNSTEMFIYKLNFCCKNEVETESILHGNISLCEKVFYPCQGIAGLKKKEEKLLFLENERKRNKTESISTAVGRSKGGAHLDTWVMNKAYMCDVPARGTHTHTHTRYPTL